MVSDNNPAASPNFAGHSGAHSVPSGLSYTDVYNELVGGLSEELVHRFSLMREQDATSRHIAEDITEMLRTPPDQVSPAKLREKFEKLYAQRLRISSEKLAEARAAYDMVDKLIMRLDKDMRKIDEEIRVKESDAGYLASAIAAGTASASVKPEKILTQLNQPAGNGVGVVANILSSLMNSEETSADKDTKKSGNKRKEPEASSGTNKDTPNLCLGKPVQLPSPYAPDEDPHEPKYCVCERVSYGEMIACDNPTCIKEWFHFECVGLEAKPKGKWYCDDCRISIKRTKTK